MEYKIQNSDTIKEIRDTARLSISEGFPTALNDKVIPVIDVNPKHARVCDIVKTAVAQNATSATVYTTPTDQDFYLVGWNLNLIKDATSTSTASGIKFTVNGAQAAHSRIASLSLTAQTANIVVVLDKPIKLDRNTTVTIENGTNVANITLYGTIFGYTVNA